MNRYLLKRTLLLLLCGGLICMSAVAQSKKDGDAEPLTNIAVVKLVKAGFKEKTVIAIISARAPRFDLSTERMIELKKNNVSEKIILAMLARQQGMDISDMNWGDDAFFDDPNRSKGGESAKDANPGNSGTLDIFGSNGGSRAQSKTRGGGGGAAEGETETTGSATVRIIRPPTEAGGSGLKLEKIPTLNNDSIINLVEAGFSDGTIVRRIEQSPVDFDLSPAKVTDLRKHQVSDKVLAAMKTAMGDGPKVGGAVRSPNGTSGQQ